MSTRGAAGYTRYRAPCRCVPIGRAKPRSVASRRNEDYFVLGRERGAGFKSRGQRRGVRRARFTLFHRRGERPFDFEVLFYLVQPAPIARVQTRKIRGAQYYTRRARGHSLRGLRFGSGDGKGLRHKNKPTCGGRRGLQKRFSYAVPVRRIKLCDGAPGDCRNHGAGRRVSYFNRDSEAQTYH
mgnify:CR=1 FL=1